MRLLLPTSEYKNAPEKDLSVSIPLKITHNEIQEDELYEQIDEFARFNYEQENCHKYILYGKTEILVDDGDGGKFETLDSTKFEFSRSNYDTQIVVPDKYTPLAEYKFKLKSVDGNNIVIDNTISFTKGDVVVLFLDSDNYYPAKVIDIDLSTGGITLDKSYAIDNTWFILPSITQFERTYKTVNENNLSYYDSGAADLGLNVFGDKIKQFHTVTDINIEGVKTFLDLPLLNLYLIVENRYYEKFSMYKSNLFTNTSLNLLALDKVEFDFNEMVETVIDKVCGQATFQSERFFYEKVFAIPVRKLSSVITEKNYSEYIDNIPYAFIFGDGSVHYREKLPIGLFEEDETGIAYPFMNNFNYLYLDFKLFIRRTAPIKKIESINIEISEDFAEIETLGVKRLC